MIPWRLALLSTVGMLVACVSVKPLEKTALRPERLPTTLAATRLLCPARLSALMDARPAGESAGVFRNQDLHFEGAAEELRRRLVSAGMTEGAAAGMTVEVRLMRLYIVQKHQVNTPVVVLEARVDGDVPFVVRPHVSTINWAGSEKELYAELGRALESANHELVDVLNRRCAARD